MEYMSKIFKNMDNYNFLESEGEFYIN